MRAGEAGEGSKLTPGGLPTPFWGIIGPGQDITTRTPITWMEVTTISIVTLRSIWHNSAADLFAFWKIFAANLRILWRHLSSSSSSSFSLIVS